MRRRPLLQRALLATLALLAAGPALAQKSEAEIEDDIAFAKGLAKDWGFVDLATDVITRIEREGVPTRQRERLGLTKCEIYEVAAVNERDKDRRNQLFESALSAYEDFIEQNRLSAALPEAEAGFVRLSALYGRSLEISLEDAVGEQAAELAQRRIDVLTKAVAKTGDLIGELKSIEDKSERQKAELYELMLNRGSMLLDIGKAQESGQFSFEQAIATLEEVVFTAGEGTPPALRAYDLIGRVYAAQQQWDLARDFFEAVIEMAIPSDPDAWREMVRELELTQADEEKRWLFVELATEGLVNAYASMGEMERAAHYALHLYNTQKREGFAYSLQLGYPSLLAAARVLLESGGWVAGDLNGGDARWYPTEEEAKEAVSNRRNRLSCTDFALRIADQVNKENKGNILQVRAQKLIAEVIEQPGVEVDPGVLYEAAEGQYNEGENDAAIVGFKRVLRSLEGKDNATRLQYGPKIFFRLGRTYRRMDRPLEAALAFQEGCTTWRGDPEYDDDNAKGFYDSMQEVARKSPGDQAISALLAESENIAADLSTRDADEINFNLGRKAYREDDFATAIQRFSEVKPTGLDHEKALVYIAVCKLQMGQAAEAQRLLDQYLEEFVKDPTMAIGNSPAKAAKRQDAMAMAEFYRGLIAFKRAERADESGNADESMWQQVIDLVGTYHERYPDQTGYAPVLMNSVMKAYLGLGDTASARRIYDQMAETYPDHSYTGYAGIQLYNSLKGLRNEAEQAGEVDRAQQLLVEMAKLLEFGRSSGSAPDFDRLRAESVHWRDLGEWAKAEEVLTRIVSRFEDDPERAEEMQKRVLPDLAHVLLEQKKVDQAHDILAGLMEAEGRPQKQVLIDYCRSVTGWVEGEARDIQIVPGAAATVEELQKATMTLDGLAKSLEQVWSCEWYAMKFQVAYGYYVWATADWSPNKDSSKKETAKLILNALTVELGPDFRGGSGVDGVDTSCEAAAPELAAQYGDDRLRSRLVWLLGKVR